MNAKQIPKLFLWVIGLSMLLKGVIVACYGVQHGVIAQSILALFSGVLALSFCLLCIHLLNRYPKKKR